MKTSVLATKVGMTQAWTTQGKRVAVTRCLVEPVTVIAQHPLHPQTNNPDNTLDQQAQYFEVGYGTKKLKNMAKPLRSKLEKSGFSLGAKLLKGMQFETVAAEGTSFVGQRLNLVENLAVGDVVKVQGLNKGRGFAGAMKRHGFKGVGGRTHGQSDRQRAVGSIAAGTTPGRIFKGKRMPGHMGTETTMVSGLVVVYVNAATNEVWLSGPVPGANSSVITILKTGDKKDMTLNLDASGIKVPEVVANDSQEVTPEPTQEEAKPENDAPATEAAAETK